MQTKMWYSLSKAHHVDCDGAASVQLWLQGSVGALRGQIHLQTSSSLVPQPGQPLVCVSVRHIAHTCHNRSFIGTFGVNNLEGILSCRGRRFRLQIVQYITNAFCCKCLPLRRGTTHGKLLVCTQIQLRGAEHTDPHQFDVHAVGSRLYFSINAT